MKFHVKLQQWVCLKIGERRLWKNVVKTERESPFGKIIEFDRSEPTIGIEQDD